LAIAVIGLLVRANICAVVKKYATNFTGKQVYYKYHKLKGEWKVILKSKSAIGASFDDEQKKIFHDKIEVVRMKAVSIYT
jgi:hypothetical protein